MAYGQTIKLYLPDGHPTGLMIAEILNWTGKVLSFPRGILPQVLKNRPELKSTGVYFLIGSDPDNPLLPIVYIGESDVVSQRLIQHDRDESKAFFEQVVLIVSKDANLTKGHVRYLESKLLDIASAQGMVQIKNGNLGQPVSLPESDISDMEAFLRQLRIILPVLGLSFLQELPKKPEQPQKAPSASSEEGLTNGPTFELSFLSGLIKATAYEQEGQFVILNNSLVRNPEQATPSAPKAYCQQAEYAKQQGLILPVENQPEVYRLAQDMVFKTPSGAATFVCGTSMSGKWAWKLKDQNISYGEWRSRLLEQETLDQPLC